MERAEIKQWAKEKIKGHIWELLIPILVAGILTGLTIGGKTTYEDGQLQTTAGINLGFFLYFVTVGLVSFIKAFNNDQPHEFKDLFKFANDYVRIFLTNLLQTIFIFLWALLLIVPGIMKAFSYALVPYILADEKYKDMKAMDILKLSETMMKGHRMDYFVFGLSYFGWFLLGAITCGLAFIYVAPYFTVAQVKFLDEVKTKYESENK